MSAERFVREARAAEPAPTPAPYSTGPSSFARQSRRTTARVGGSQAYRGAAGGSSDEEYEGEGEGEGDEDEDDVDAPPSYGELHGRVLGTGQPPSGESAPADVNMVNAQDLEQVE